MQRLPKRDSKTARILIGMASTRRPPGRGCMAAHFRPRDVDYRTTSAILHNLARRELVERLGLGEWRLTAKGTRLVGRIRSGR